MYRLPATIDEPEFVALLGYWESKRNGNALPARADIDPVDLRRLLPHVLLIDVVRTDGAVRFRFRVAGTAFTPLVGRDPTGLHVDEMGPPDRVGPVHHALSAIVESGKPCLLIGRPTLRNELYLTVKRLGVPLASDGRQVDMILAVWLAEPRPGSMLDVLEGETGQPTLLEGD